MAKLTKSPVAEGTTAGGLLTAAFRRAVLRRQEQNAADSPLPALRSRSASTAPAKRKAEMRGRKSKAALVSPLAPEALAALPPLAGVELAAGEAGIRYRGRPDLVIAAMPPGTTVAGVFTRSTMPGAPVEWCKENLSEGKREPTARLLVVNSGNANVFTGRAGAEIVESVAQAGAALVKCRKHEVFQASTGVIGEPMPKGKIEAVLPRLYKVRRGTSAAWTQAARAIMTTDTYPKLASRRAKIGGATVTINGIAKGSGMIAPDLGTMLAYLFTDAALPSEVLQTLLVLGVRDTFNAITVDSDSSTSDMVLLFATGKGAAHDKIERPGDPRLRGFRMALHDLMGDLARQVICDGEGATKLVSITVTRAASAKAARAIALSIANSPLVKTAVAGCDANWGRVVMAIGKAGEEADRDKLAIKFGGLPVARNGARDSRYDEAKLSAYMKGRQIAIEADVGVGEGRALIWTCDLTHRYIDINGSYRS
jgi:glutamate N-acetyltransferase / amino-acid N-acetyltransferase